MVKFIERKPTFVGADTKGIDRKFLNLAYADGQRNQLDIYLPNQEQSNYPVIIDVYTWRYGKGVIFRPWVVFGSGLQVAVSKRSNFQASGCVLVGLTCCGVKKL